MKKTLLSLLSLILFLPKVEAQRYLTEVFPDVTITSNVVYAQNYQFLTGSAVLTPLVMDVYEPAGAPDPLTERPLIILAHTGSYLPICYNGQPTGLKTDSTIVEMCKQFARRGYVAAAMTYRQGWIPTSSIQDIRTGTLLQAAYRSIQDGRSCVRWWRQNFAIGGNTHKIDTSKIIFGGAGTGGYISYGMAHLNDTADLWLPKFISNITDPAVGLFAGQSVVQQSIWGDFEGFGGTPGFNNDNTPGYSSEIDFTFNLGGAIGDTSWMEPGEAPCVSFHVVGDPFAPYIFGPVIVPPPPGQFVVDVFGSGAVMPIAQNFGNTSCYNSGFTYNDQYSLYAQSVNGNVNGLYPFYTTPLLQAAPWEWFDSTTTVAFCNLIGAPAGSGSLAYSNAILTNPDMSKAKALLYIDTVMNYLNPRIVNCFNLLGVGINEVSADELGLQINPNPAGDFTTVQLGGANTIDYIRLYDLSGKHIRSVDQIGSGKYTLNRQGIEAGMYLLRVGSQGKEAGVKLLFR